MALRNITIEFTSSPSAADMAALTVGIDETAARQGVTAPCEPFAFFAYDENQEVLAGCNGYLVYGAVYTDQLWVRQDLRGQGMGRALMEKAHDHGRQNGCAIATVRTMRFQKARAFYEKLGYEGQFEESGYAQEQTCLYLKKIL